MNTVRVWLVLLSLVLPAAEADPRVSGRPAVRGVASWYGWRHDGRVMANGRRFHALGLSAASRTLPLGTWVQVTNLANDLRIELEITDRGPYVAGRILDISLGAARRLRMVDEGLAMVSIETIVSLP